MQANRNNRTWVGGLLLTVLLAGCTEPGPPAPGRRPADVPEVALGSTVPRGAEPPRRGTPRAIASPSTPYGSREQRVAWSLDFEESADGFHTAFAGTAGRSRVDWANGRLEVTSDRRDLNVFVHRPLPFRLTPTTSFTVSCRFGVIAQGNHQGVFPLALTTRSDRSLKRSSSYVLYRSHDANLVQEPRLETVYLDSSGRVRLATLLRQPWNDERRLEISYDSKTHLFRTRIMTPGGQILTNDEYRIGSEPTDGFEFEVIAIGAEGKGPNESAEPTTQLWVDDVTVAATTAEVAA